MPNLRLSFACGPYDRIQALYDGRVGIDGVDLIPMPISHPMEIFSRMLDDDAFDISEMSLAHCFALRARNVARFVSIPIFPSRMFRHGFIFVNARSGIQKPAALGQLTLIELLARDEDPRNDLLGEDFVNTSRHRRCRHRPRPNDHCNALRNLGCSL